MRCEPQASRGSKGWGGVSPWGTPNQPTRESGECYDSSKLLSEVIGRRKTNFMLFKLDKSLLVDR